MLIASLLFAGAILATPAPASAQVVGDIESVTFTPRDDGIVILTRQTSQSGDVARLYFTPFPKLRPKLITGSNTNYQISNSGRFVAAETNASNGEDLVVFRLSDGRRAGASTGIIGSFSADDKRYAFTNGVCPVVMNLANGKTMALTGVPASIAKFAPPSGTVEGFRILGWNRNGLILSTDYKVPGKSDYVETLLFVDPATGHVLGKAPRRKERPVTLGDGSRVVDELASKEDSMMGATRIVRFKDGKRKVIFEQHNISAGHEESAEFRVSARAMKVVVYGVPGAEHSDRAWIWVVDPLTGRRKVLVSGRYRMPKWADGNSMAVDVSANGEWLAYADFWNHSTFHLQHIGH